MLKPTISCLPEVLPGVQDAVAALGGDGQRLLAEDVLARLQRGDGVLLVAEVGRGDGDGVDVGAVEQLAIVVGDERSCHRFRCGTLPGAPR